jgi:hypothetical protein
MPMSPLASTDNAASTQAATSQRSVGRSSSAARAKASTAAAIVPPTSMSRLAYWPATKKNGVVASTPSAHVAARGPCQRRATRTRAAPIAKAPTNGPKRAVNALTPPTAIAAMSSQYISGGLWKKGRPLSSGTRPSPCCSMSRATVA